MAAPGIDKLSPETRISETAGILGERAHENKHPPDPEMLTNLLPEALIEESAS
jgi:hypothetical protein